MIARHCAFLCATAMLDTAAAGDHAERAVELARELDAPGMLAEGLAFRARWRHVRGDASAAVADAREALALSRAAGMTYMGPTVLGVLACVTADAAERAAALAEGERRLEGNGLMHNHLLLRCDAIDIALQAGDADTARRHADALGGLGASAADEPLYVVRFHAARGRSLAAWQAGARSRALAAELARLHAEARAKALHAAAAALEAALAEERH